MDQLKQEISLVFDLPLSEIQNANFDDHLVRLLDETHSDVLAVKLIYKFHNSYTYKTKRTLASTILHLLVSPDISIQPKSAYRGSIVILTDLIIDTAHPKYDSLIDFLKFIEVLFSSNPEDIFVEIIDELSRRCASASFFDDFMLFVYPLLTLAEIKVFQELMTRPEMWNVHIVTPARDAENQIINNTYKKERRSFLFAFLEVFIYNERNDNVFDMFLKPETNTPTNKKHLKNVINKKIDEFHLTMYSFFNKLFTKNESIKKLFHQFLITVVKINAERTKPIHDLGFVDTDAVMFNLSGILSKFCSDIIRNKTYDAIKLGFLHNFEEKLIDPNIKIKKNEEAINCFISCIFFCKLKFIQLGHIHILSTTKILNVSINHIESGFETNNISPEFTELVKRSIPFNKARRSAYQLIESSVLFEGEFEFLEFVVSYLISSYEQVFPEICYINEIDKAMSKLTLNSEDCSPKREKREKAIKQIFCSVKTFPEYIYDILFTLQVSFKKVLKHLMSLAAEIFKSDLTNVSFKLSLVKSFNNRDDVVLTPDVFTGLLKYYMELNKLDDFQFDRKHARSSIIDALYADISNKIASLTTKNPIHLKFLYSFLNDIKLNLSEGLAAIQDISDFQCNNHVYSKYLLEEKKRVFLRNQEVAANSFKQLNTFLVFMNHLITTCIHNIFANRLIIRTFVGILNCNLKIIMAPSYLSIQVLDKEKYNFDPRNILFSIINIYLVMNKRCSQTDNTLSDLHVFDRNVFIEHIVYDSIYFTIELFIKTLDICEKKSVLKEKELSQLKEFVKKLIRCHKEKDQNPIRFDSSIEIPEEFIDPLTCCVMEKPVKLHTSSKVVDMETYEMLMLGDCLDPFNRKPLIKESVSVEHELKLKIDEWFNKYK
ncbi:Ubiquitin conjugation factor E4 [Cucumispora dikerogammari]|nr:Ubiquitin conjugation factor E4 [Cucumispora dikerogammari]